MCGGGGASVAPMDSRVGAITQPAPGITSTPAGHPAGQPWRLHHHGLHRGARAKIGRTYRRSTWHGRINFNLRVSSI